MPDNFIRNRDGSFSRAVVGSNRITVGCTLPLGDAVGIEVKEVEKMQKSKKVCRPDYRL
jgi:hypothetical protein